MNLPATDRPGDRRSLKRRLKRLLTVWKHGRLEIKFNLLFYAIGDRKCKKRGIGVRTVLAAAVVILTVLGCMAAWMPLGSPAGVYDAPKLAVLEDGAKALLVISEYVQKRSARSFTTAFFMRPGASAANFAKCSSAGRSRTNRPGVMAQSVIIFCA